MRQPRFEGPFAARHGFTLVEAMIVLVILGVLTSIVARGISASGYRGDGAARTVRSAMQQAQRIAILRQYDVVVSFDSARGRFRVHEDADNDHVAEPGELATWHSIESTVRFTQPAVGIDGKVAAGFAAPASPIDQMPSIAFHRDGSASDAAVIYLRDGSAGAKTMRAVAVTRSTGRIQWYKGNGTTWKPGGL
ncbi:MAG TPA: GspH/FimT family protein [Gemmatimonadaceae bacterium]|nr:GspH/FimT family protein [Gemmatimonadaceae bacterium]